MIFELPDQYESICRRALFVCGAKLDKTFKTNIIEILILIMCIPGKINFLQLGRYGRRFRDGHQFTGLLDFQARDGKALDFAYNASLAAVHVTKVLRKQTGTRFSIGQIKSLMVNAHFFKRFFELSGIDQHKNLNSKLVKELFGLVTDAA